MCCRPTTRRPDVAAGRRTAPPAAPPPGEATVSHLAPRLSSGRPTAARPWCAHPQWPGHAAPSHAGPDFGPGFGQCGTGTSGFGPDAMGDGGRPRRERPGSGRPPVPEPQVGEPTAPSLARPRLRPSSHLPSQRSPGQSGRGSRANLEGRARTSARTGFPGAAGVSPRTGRSDATDHGSPRRLVRKPLRGVLDCCGLRRGGSSRGGSVTRRGGFFGPGGTRGRAGNASGRKAARGSAPRCRPGTRSCSVVAPARLALTARRRRSLRRHCSRNDPVPGRDVGLHMAGGVGRAGAQSMPSASAACQSKDQSCHWYGPAGGSSSARCHSPSPVRLTSTLVTGPVPVQALPRMV